MIIMHTSHHLMFRESGVVHFLLNQIPALATHHACPPVSNSAAAAGQARGQGSTVHHYGSGACVTSRRRNIATKAPAANRFALWFWVYEHGF
jgi:hypothetical protein